MSVTVFYLNISWGISTKMSRFPQRSTKIVTSSGGCFFWPLCFPQSRLSDCEFSLLY